MAACGEQCSKVARYDEGEIVLPSPRWLQERSPAASRALSVPTRLTVPSGDCGQDVPIAMNWAQSATRMALRPRSATQECIAPADLAAKEWQQEEKRECKESARSAVGKTTPRAELSRQQSTEAESSASGLQDSAAPTPSSARGEAGAHDQSRSSSLEIEADCVSGLTPQPTPMQSEAETMMSSALSTEGGSTASKSAVGRRKKLIRKLKAKLPKMFPKLTRASM